MNMTGVSIFGWLHTLGATLAILIGALLIFGAKGTPRHRYFGRVYLYTLLATNILSFAVFHFDIASFVPFRGGAGVFGLFHWEAVFTLFFLLLGWFAATRQRRAVFAYLHPISMLITYYMLIGGLVNEIFVRVAFIGDFAMANAHGASSPAQTPLAGMVQGTAMLIFIAMLVYFIVKVALYRKRARSGATPTQAAFS